MNKHIYAIGFLIGLSQDALGSGRLRMATQFANLSAPRVSPSERQDIFKASVDAVTEQVSSFCRQQNQANRKGRKISCQDDYCLESANVARRRPPIDVSLTAGHSSQSGYFIFLEVQYHWGPELSNGSGAMCYHPRLSPIVMAFSRDLNAKLWLL